MATSRFTLRIQNSLLQTVRLREAHTLGDVLDAAEWTLKDNTHLSPTRAARVAAALAIPGVTVTFQQYTLCITEDRL